MKHPFPAPWRGLAAAHLVAATGGALLCLVPLFDLLGFEFSAAVGCLLAYVCGWRACGAAAAARHLPAAGSGVGAFPGAVLLRCAAENLSLLLTPAAVIGLHSLRVPTCNWREGFGFYALLPLPAVLYGTAVGFALGLAWKVRRARLAFCLWSLATYAFAVWRLLAEPPKFAYNAFIGFFPGPIYDTVVPITPTLVMARADVVAQALVITLVAVLAWDGTRGRLARIIHAWRGERAVAAGVALVLGAGLVAVEWRGGALGLHPDRRFIQRALGGKLETEHFHIYYDRGALPPARAALLGREHEFRYDQLRSFFGFAPPGKIGSYVYASAAQKKRLMGFAGTSFEDALHDEFHINAADDPHPVLMHEMAHIFAAHFDRWAPVCFKIGIHEGIAVAAEWNARSRADLTPHEACAAMDSLHLLPDVRRALGAFGFWTESGARAYTAAGSFVRFLVDTYGIERIRPLWRFGDFRKAYGKPLAALVGEWRASLRRVRLTPQQMHRAERLYRAPAVFDVPCAHEQARLEADAAAAHTAGRPAEAESLYARLRDLSPDDPERDLDLGRAQLQGGDPKSALEIGRQALASPHLAEELQSQALRLGGDAAWKVGGPEAANYYEQGLHASAFEPEARAFEVALAALRDPLLAPILRDYLTDSGQPEAAGFAALARARLAAPGSPLPRYLLGRRLFIAGDFVGAAGELRAAAADSSLGPLARRAALDLLGISLFRSDSLEGAKAAFEQILARDLEPSERLRLADWVARCDWTRSDQSN